MADGTSFSPKAGIAGLSPTAQWAMCLRVANRVLRGPEGRHMSRARRDRLRAELPGEIFILALHPDAVAERAERQRRAGVQVDTIITESVLLRVATNHVRDLREQFVRRRDYARKGFQQVGGGATGFESDDIDECGDSDECGDAQREVILIDRITPELWLLAYQEAEEETRRCGMSGSIEHDDGIHAAPGQQMDLFSQPFSQPADPQNGLIPIASVLIGTASRPECGCVRGYVRRVPPHVGLYCCMHGRWLAWLDAAGRERARRAGATDV